VAALDVTLTVPDELVEAIAHRVAALLRDKPERERESPWMSFEEARAYLGFTKDALYKLTAARAIPCRKKAGGQGLLFHRDELDAWLEEAYPRLDLPGQPELSSIR
jgi:excisionase family DNA binding protein